MKFRTEIVVILSIFSSCVDAFLVPKAYNAPTRNICLSALPNFDLMASSSTLLAEFAPPTEEIVEASSAASGAGGGLENALSSVGGVLYNIGIAATAIIFFLAGAAYLFGNWIIPKAAEELEKECKELNPELWDKYQGMLEPGQTIAQNPQLMQQLGAELQPLVNEKVRRMEAGEESNTMTQGITQQPNTQQSPTQPNTEPKEEAINVSATRDIDWD